MFETKRNGHVAANLALAAVFLAGASHAFAAAEESERAVPPSATPPSMTQIYQQRTADGAIVLTDRPVAGAVTQRTWKSVPEDAAAGRERRERARLEAAAVDERIQRQIDSDIARDHELTLARVHLADAQARRDAERARAEEQAQGAVIYVPIIHRPVHRPPHDPRPGSPRPRPPGHGGFGKFGELPG